MPTNLSTFLGSTFIGTQGAQGLQGLQGRQGWTYRHKLLGKNCCRYSHSLKSWYRNHKSNGTDYS